jgi:CNT family concentrative nucleoside transporter
MERFIGLIGIVVLLAIALGVSTDRRRFPTRLVLSGLGLQLVLALLMIKTPGVADAVHLLATFVAGVIARADAGIRFIFGDLVEGDQAWGFIFAVKVLPVIIFFASLMAMLYYLGVMQRLVAALAWLLRGTLGVTGTEALAMASNVFVGQTEAPLCIKPYLDKMTRSQLATLMVGGFATIAGSVLAGYVSFLAGGDQERAVLFTKHLITASVISAPAAFVFARIIFPETETPIDEGLHAVKQETGATNLLDAAGLGATDGLRLALNVGAMLIAFVSILALLNWPLEALSDVQSVRAWLDARGIESLNVQTILGWIFMPLAWAMGVPWEDCLLFGRMLGEKLILTEFIAYLTLGQAIGDGAISSRTAQIGAYALCGFANFASIGIQIGGLSALAPSRRADFAALAFKAMIGGALASWMTACVAGIVI